MAERKVPLMRHLTRTLGLRNGYRTMAFIVAWITAEADHERQHPDVPFDINVYMKWWKAERSTTYRDQALFRRALPTMMTPTDLLVEMERQRVSSPERLRWSS